MPNPILLSWQLLDDHGEKRTLVYYVDSLATNVSLQAFIDAHTTKLDAIVGAQPLKVTVTKPFVLGATKPAPDADHPNGQGAVCAFSAAGTAYRHGLFVPSFSKDLITGGQITEAGALATWTASMLGGEGSLTLVDAAGRALADFLGGTPRDRK